MNKFSVYVFCFIIIIIGLNIIGTCNDNKKIKDNSVIEEDSCVFGIDNTIDTLLIEEVDSSDLGQSTLSPIAEYYCID